MITLPPIISRRDFPSDEEMIGEAYRVFNHDFIFFPPSLNGTVINTRDENMANGYNKTFWHIITEGDHRLVDRVKYERLERIPWINPAIDGQPDNEWMLWKEARDKNRSRIHIFSQKYMFLIVVEQNNTDLKNVFWTAYPIEYNHEAKKLLKRYNVYK